VENSKPIDDGINKYSALVTISPFSTKWGIAKFLA
jgi:hypothetical protein